MRLFEYTLSISSLFLFPLFAIDHYDAPLEGKVLDPNTPSPLFVSLGSSCEIPHLLRDLNLRYVAFPLDWVISIDQAGLLRCIEEDFLHFTEKAYLVPKSNGVLVNTYYKMEFPHEGNCNTTPYAELLAKFQAKYNRRIERYRELAQFSKDIIFIRASYVNATSDAFLYPDPTNLYLKLSWGEELLLLLKNRFPNNRFHLILVNHHPLLTAKLEGCTEEISILWHNPYQTPSSKAESVKEIFCHFVEKTEDR